MKISAMMPAMQGGQWNAKSMILKNSVLCAIRSQVSTIAGRRRAVQTEMEIQDAAIADVINQLNRRINNETL
jgi:hypothetical protein